MTITKLFGINIYINININTLPCIIVSKEKYKKKF